MSEATPFVVKVTWAEHLRATYLSERPSRWFRAAGALFLMVAGVVIVGEIALAAITRRPSLLAFPLSMGAMGLIAGVRLHLEYARSPTGPAPTTVLAGVNAIQLSSLRSQVTIGWPEFTKWRETTAFLLLFRADKPLLVIPKRFLLTQSQLQVLRSLLRERVGAAG